MFYWLISIVGDRQLSQSVFCFPCDGELNEDTVTWLEEFFEKSSSFCHIAFCLELTQCCLIKPCTPQTFCLFHLFHYFHQCLTQEGMTDFEKLSMMLFQLSCVLFPQYTLRHGHSEYIEWKERSLDPTVIWAYASSAKPKHIESKPIITEAQELIVLEQRV